MGLRDISELVFLWVQDINATDAERLTGKSNHAVIDRYRLCRQVCAAVVEAQPKLLGTPEWLIQIDESYFAGRRKYNRGRLERGDLSLNEPTEENERPRWVFGIYQSPKKVRYWAVERRDADTLVPLITNTCEVGSVIHSDQWRAYNSLGKLGYDHHTVNHKTHFLDPESGAHTQGIERSWQDAKLKIVKKARGTPYIQEHLDEASWRQLHRDSDDIFVDFLKDVHMLKFE